MNEPGDFLRRWSRRKRAAALDTGERTKPKGAAGDPVSETSETSAPGECEPPFDPAGLPPIESIGPGSDIGAFLAAGVPADLKGAALRRAWSSDPMIRDFVGLSENSWDFNATGSVAGFGPILEEEIERLLTQVVGESNSPSAPADQSATTSDDDRSAAGTGDSGTAEETASAAAPTAEIAAQDKQPSDCDLNDTTRRDEAAATTRQQSSRRAERPLPSRHRHGSALPE